MGHFSGGRGMSICSTMICFRISLALAASLIFCFCTRARSSSMMTVVAFSPQSAITRMSSSSS